MYSILQIKLLTFGKVSVILLLSAHRGFRVDFRNKSYYNERRKGAAGIRSAPKINYEVTACLEAGRLLLFLGLNDQADNADEQRTELEQFRISDHKHHLLFI